MRWRVTDEAAAVTVLTPDHPVLTRPNPIGPADWQGWVKERGLYFAADRDPAYRPLVEMADPGEAPLRGSLVTADGGPRPAMLILLGGAFAGVCAVIVQKILAQSDGEPVLMVYYSVAITVISAIPAGFVWRTPMLEDLPLIGLIGLTAIAGQFCFLRAYKLAQASFLAPISYFQMVIGAAMGFVIFQEVPTWWTIGGAIVIAFCVIAGGRGGQAKSAARRTVKSGSD